MPSDHLSSGEQRLLAKFQADVVQQRQQAQQLPYGQRPRRRGPRMPRLPEPKSGSIAAIISGIEHCGPMTAAESAMLWAKELFASSEVRAWLEAGMKTADLGLIVDFRESGVPPEAMGWKVRGETILDRIRVHHYSALAVVKTLQTAGLLTRKSA
jgi:hypothetical protein